MAVSAEPQGGSQDGQPGFVTPLDLALHHIESGFAHASSTLFVEAVFADVGSPLPSDLPPSHHPGEWTKYAIQAHQGVSPEDAHLGDIVIISDRRWTSVQGLPIIDDGSDYQGRVPGDRVGIVAAVSAENRHIDVAANLGVETGVRFDRVCCVWRPPVVSLPIGTPVPIVPVVHEADGSPVFRLGNYDQRVAVLSRVYRGLGFAVPISNFYGEVMAAATAEIQRRYGRPDTGVIDGDTWSLLGSIVHDGHAAPPALTDPAGGEGRGEPLTPAPAAQPAAPVMEEPPPAPVVEEPTPAPVVVTPELSADGNPLLRVGVVDPSVDWLSAQLRSLGDPAPETAGVYTEALAATVASFQGRNGLTITGETDDATWDKLAELLLARRPAEPKTIEARLDELEARVNALESR